jgi:hypothetical protein
MQRFRVVPKVADGSDELERGAEEIEQRAHRTIDLAVLGKHSV